MEQKCHIQDHEFYAEFKHPEGWKSMCVFKAFSWSDAYEIAENHARRTGTTFGKLNHVCGLNDESK